MNARSFSPYDACLQEAFVHSAEWIPRWLATLHGALSQREAAAGHLRDKQAFGRARQVLESHRALVGERFLSTLTQVLRGGTELDGPALCVPPRGVGRSLDSLSFDDLELMDDQQVQDTVELARVQQVVRMVVDLDLVDFNARLCRAQGHELVRRQANPLRPDVVVRALVTALGSLHLEESVRARWLHVGAMALGHELQTLYRRLTDQLDRWGVQPAGYEVLQRRPARPPAHQAPRRNESVPAVALTGTDALLTLDHLHRLLVGNLDVSGHGVSDHGRSGSGNAMVRTLAAEVVSLMLRRIHEDQRLLAPVRELVQGLKPALLQLALTEPRFFADRDNPARRLLDVITARGLAFTTEQDRGFANYAKQLKDTVQALQAPTQSLPERLPGLLRSMSEGEAGAQRSARSLAMQTLVRVEQRNLLAVRVAAEIQASHDLGRAPGVVRRFIGGPWSQVVAQARLDAAQPEAALPADAPALRYMAVLPDLLWSSQLALASCNRPRLIKVIPSLLRTLREGLDSIDYPRSQAEAFFHTVMGLHEAAYKTQRGDAGTDPVSSGLEAEPPATWVQASEVRETGFMEDQIIDTQPAFLETQPQACDRPHPSELDPRTAGLLSVGTWVDLREGDEDLRCQLGWVSPHHTLFLFSAASGRRVTLTLHGMQRLQALGRLRVVAGQGLVDDALDAVAREALRNSGQTSDLLH